MIEIKKEAVLLVENYDRKTSSPIFSEWDLVTAAKYISWEYRDQLLAAGDPIWIAQRNIYYHKEPPPIFDSEKVPIDRIVLGTNKSLRCDEYIGHLFVVICWMLSAGELFDWISDHTYITIVNDEKYHLSFSDSDNKRKVFIHYNSDAQMLKEPIFEV